MQRLAVNLGNRMKATTRKLHVWAGLTWLLLAGWTFADPPHPLPNAFCPVTPDEPAKPEIWSDHENTRIHFCRQACKEAFEENPGRFVGSGSLTGPASQAAGASFEDAARQLLMRHPALAAARAQAGAALFRADYADVFPDPALSVGRFVESVQTRTGPQETVFNFSQGIPWFGIRGQREQIASAIAEKTAGDEAALSLELVRALADAFFEYAFIGEATRLTGENLRLLQDLEPVVETKVAAGGTLNALLRLKVESGRLGDQRHALEAKRAKYSAILHALLNESGDALWPWPAFTAPSRQAFDVAALRAGLAADNPLLSAQDHQVDVLEGRERLARLEGYPDFSVGLNYIQLGPPVMNPTAPDAGKDPWGIHASVRLPLWRGAQKAKRAEASRLRAMEEFRREDLAVKLNAELQARVSLHTDALRRLKVYGEDLLVLARQAVENSRAGYENNTATVLELIDSERSLLALELEYWRACADAHIHRIHILSLTRPHLDALIVSRELP